MRSLVAISLFSIALGCGDDRPPSRPEAPPAWDKSLPATSDVLPVRRGLRSVRGMIHLHSVYSHDACDYDPLPGGQPAQPCFQHLRDALCRIHLDYAFLTDHATSMCDHDWDTLFLPLPGDQPVVDAMGRHVASWLSCPDGFRTLAMVGGENDLMPVGLWEHVAADPAARRQIMTGRDRASADAMRQHGAVVVVAHGEGHELAQLREVAPEAMEVYNLHANIDPRIRMAMGLDPNAPIMHLGPFLSNRVDAPEPDLALLAIFEENPAERGKFDTLLGEGRHLGGTLGADAHENAVSVELSDHERGDSYRRVLRWFSNHLLVSELTPAALKDALAHGRGYGAFELFGAPIGFDFRAETAGGVVEMGATANLGDAPTLVVETPQARLAPGLEAPALRVSIVRVDAAGGTEVASGDGTQPLRVAASTPGAYRAEIRVTPHHLKPYMGFARADLLHEFVWIYANPIYIR